MSSIDSFTNSLNAQLQSPFFSKLPGEIRNMIYGYLHTGYVIFVDGSPHAQFGDTFRHGSRYIMPKFRFRYAKLYDPALEGLGPLPPDSLLKPAIDMSTFRRVCQKMYEETQGLDFSDNIFNFSTSLVLQTAHGHLNRFPSYLPKIRKVYIPDFHAYYAAGFHSTRHGSPLPVVWHERFRQHLPNVKHIYIAPGVGTMHYDDDPRFILNWLPPHNCFDFGIPSAPMNPPLYLHFADLFRKADWACMKADMESRRVGRWIMTASWRRRLSTVLLYEQMPFERGEFGWIGPLPSRETRRLDLLDQLPFASRDIE